jgi:hypothetical protein
MTEATTLEHLLHKFYLTELSSHLVRNPAVQTVVSIVQLWIVKTQAENWPQQHSIQTRQVFLLAYPALSLDCSVLSATKTIQ